MLIQIMSDLHLESCNYRPEISGDVLVLAGDITSFNAISKYYDFIKNIEVPILAVLGNHEFYSGGRYDFDIARDHYRTIHKSNFHLLDNSIFRIEDYNFIGCTLWNDLSTDKSPDIDFKRELTKCISDFRTIGNFSVSKMISEYKKSEEFIFNNLRKGMKNIVITHFPPHRNCTSHRFVGDTLNHYFINDIPDEKFKDITMWIHGHTHDSVDTTVNGCRIVCNPRGYSRGDLIENPHFNDSLVIDV